MKFSAGFFRKVYPFSFFLILSAAVLFWQFSPTAKTAETPEKPAQTPNYDIRADKSAESLATIEKFVAEAGKTGSLVDADRKKILEAEKNLLSRAGKLKIERGENLPVIETISPAFIQNAEKFLTAPSGEKRASIFRNFLRQNSELFGLTDAQTDALETTADYTNPDGNLSFVHFEQKIGGIPVFQGEVKAGFTRKNEIIRIINHLAPLLDYENLSRDFGSEKEAVVNAVKFINAETDSGQTKAEKIYFPLDAGIARTAWRVLLETRGGASFYVIVDAQSGTLLWRKSLTESQTQTATYVVYGSQTSMTKTADSVSPYTPGCPSPTGCAQPPAVARQSFTLVGNEPPFAFNNNGWIPDGENRTIGNAAEAGIDRMAPNGIDDNGWAFGNPARNFVYVYNPAPGIPPPGEEPLPTTQTYPPSAFQQGSITNAFYAVNRWHDETYRLGFTEQARNFQTDNFGRGGQGNDSISVEIQEWSGTNGANFAVTADGGRGRLQMFIWTSATPDRDGALDNQVIMHEATHGLSNRLHGNASGLSTNMARGMGEGWSDFYALALLSEPTDAALGTYTIGGYLIYLITPGFEANYYYGIRRFPTAILASVGPNGRPHNPLTFRYINSDCNTLIGTTTTNPNSAFPRGPIGVTNCDQIHNLGELWNVTLWEVRHQLILRHGAVEGNRRVLQYVTDGMKLAPFGPTMLQERDAIIAAAFASDPNDVLPVRRGFAIRGMGFSASIQNAGTGSNNTLVTEAFDIPNTGKSRADFDGDGRTDVSVFRPSEGVWYLNQSQNGFGALNWGLSGDRLAPGDYDNDNKTDFAVFRPQADALQPDFYVLRSSNFTYSGYSWGLPGDIPVVGDYDGDTRGDIAVYRPSNHTFYVLKSSDSSVLIYSGIESGAPATGDFDGDGKADFASYGGDGWYLARSGGNYNTVTFTRWGTAGDKAVPADYDGDRKDDFAVFRPSDGTWYIMGSAGANIFVRFGLADDVPVPGDYDGDQKADIAVYRGGTWYINRSTSGTAITQFGLIGDVPVPGAYLP